MTPAAAAGLASSTELRFGIRGGKTVLVSQHVESPQKIVRPFALPGGGALVQMISPTPGLFAGDRFDLTIEVGPGARLVFVQPSATRIHQMNDGEYAEQRIRLAVAEGGTLEFIAPTLIPFPDAALRQTVTVDLAGGAQCLYLETWAMGRIQRGESFLFRQLSSRVQVDVDACPTFRDALELCPGNAEGTGLMEGHRYLCSGFAYSRDKTLGPARCLQGFAFGPAAASGVYYARGLSQDNVEAAKHVDERRCSVEKAWGLDGAGHGRYLG